MPRVNLGWISEASSVQYGDKEAMKTAIKIKRDQAKRWRRQVQKTDQERKQIDQLLWEGQVNQEIKVDQSAPKKKIVHMTGLEQKAAEEKEREEVKKRDQKSEKLFRFKEGVI